MKKIVAILVFNLVFLKLFSAITFDQVESIHKDEAEKVTETITYLMSTLMALETDKWLANLKKRNYSYPESVLTEAELSSLLKAIDDLESGKALKTYRTGLSDKLEPIFSNIKTNALAINEPPFKRGEVKWFKGQQQWKPIVLNLFKRAKALIKSFGPQSQKQAYNWAQPEGYTSHYFPRPKSGETMRTF